MIRSVFRRASCRNQTKNSEMKILKPKGANWPDSIACSCAMPIPKEIDTEPKPELDWLATSREPDKMGPEAFLGNNRQYWGIENGTHQRLDCSALEDRLRIHDRNAVAVLGLFHRMSISLFMAWADKQSNVARPHLSDLASRPRCQSLAHDPSSHQSPHLIKPFP